MIADVEVAGIRGYTPDEPTKKYIRKKIGALDRLVTRRGLLARFKRSYDREA